MDLADMDVADMDLADVDLVDPRDEIARLEGRIEALAARIENCRKFMLAARLAIVIGGVLLVVATFGAIRLDALALTAAIAAVLGGIVVLGSNRSTANEAKAQMAAADEARGVLIAGMELRVISAGDGARKAPAGTQRRLH
jgi:hypothetical protein